ncbi:unnamed protein product [Mycena citricolor]|nr:unnamed protein product [Mycena citricolor]
MKDQVDSLVRRNVKAANLDSTLTIERSAFVKSEILAGSLKILYVAPERLNNEGFIQMMNQLPDRIALVAIDEAHCISQWGASFRPEYLKIARFCEEQDVQRVLCLTATATPQVIEDICNSFHIEPEGVFRTPVYRPNLSLLVEVAATLEKKLGILVPHLKARKGPAIIYVTLQKHTDDIALALLSRGFEGVLTYHAGMSADERQKVQEQFMEGEDHIVVATIAFGMGIDKSNIRVVAHLFMPKTLENYSQEIGRAGRDGLRSTCIMFLSSEDIPTLEGFCRGDTCSKTSIQSWLREVALKSPDADGTLSFNLYDQSRTYDIRSTVLNLSYAQLELEYNCIRAITPFYSVYEVTPLGDRQRILKDASREAKTIRKYWREKSTKFEINVVDTAQQAHVDRNELARKINAWELEGLVQTKASQVRARYSVLASPLPTSDAGIENIADKMFHGMQTREEEGIAKIRQVLKLATDDECLPRSLCRYFGGEDNIPEDGCGHCSFCLQGQAVVFTLCPPAAINPAQINAILSACHERSDPRLLARMAFGITSPKLTVMKCSTSHPLFGSMVNSDFNALVQAFDLECAKVEYISPAASSSKRTYSQTSRGRATTNKRGRRS